MDFLYDVNYYTHFLDVCVAINSFCKYKHEGEYVLYQKYFVIIEVELFYAKIHKQILS